MTTISMAQEVIRTLVFLCVIYLTPITNSLSDNLYIDQFNASGSIPVKSWKSIRDNSVVKQKLDYSCGAASITTILNYYYELSVTEEEILNLMKKNDMQASFDDMANVLHKYGFRGIGYTTSYEQLLSLKIPVIVYTKHRKNNHFSVLKGINENTVLIADPSLGNRTYSKHQFLDMWEIRNDTNLKGKILAIIPQNKNVDISEEFFTRQPRRQTAQAIHQPLFINKSP
jgi:predicted double-glycine peptidase